MNDATIPSDIPHSLQREFVTAVWNTGWTPQLHIAAKRLSLITKMNPQEFETFSTGYYQRSEM